MLWSKAISLFQHCVLSVLLEHRHDLRNTVLCKLSDMTRELYTPYLFLLWLPHCMFCCYVYFNCSPRFFADILGKRLCLGLAINQCQALLSWQLLGCQCSVLSPCLSYPEAAPGRGHGFTGETQLGKNVSGTSNLNASKPTPRNSDLVCWNSQWHSSASYWVAQTFLLSGLCS